MDAKGAGADGRHGKFEPNCYYNIIYINPALCPRSLGVSVTFILAYQPYQGDRRLSFRMGPQGDGPSYPQRPLVQVHVRSDFNRRSGYNRRTIYGTLNPAAAAASFVPQDGATRTRTLDQPGSAQSEVVALYRHNPGWFFCVDTPTGAHSAADSPGCSFVTFRQPWHILALPGGTMFIACRQPWHILALPGGSNLARSNPGIV